MPDSENFEQSIEISPIVDDDGRVIGGVMDDLRVTSDESGAIVEEVIDVMDTEGNIVAEDVATSVYDADGNLLTYDETVVLEEE